MSPVVFAEVEAEPESIPVNLPSQAGLKLVLASAEGRDAALLTLLALQRLQENYRTATLDAVPAAGLQPVAGSDTTGLSDADEVGDPAEAGPEDAGAVTTEILASPDYSGLLRQFADDRAWLQNLKPESLRLAVEPLDLFSNSFFTQKQLLELKLYGLSLELGPDLSNESLEALLVKLIFENKQRAVVRALMPYLLRQTESRSIAGWERLQQMIQVDSDFAALISGLDQQTLVTLGVELDMPVDSSIQTAGVTNDNRLQDAFSELLENLLAVPGEAAKDGPDKLTENSGTTTDSPVPGGGLDRQAFTRLIFELRSGLIGISTEFDVTLALYTLDILAALEDQHGLVFSNGLSMLTTALLDQQVSRRRLAEIAALDPEADAKAENQLAEAAGLPTLPLFDHGWLPLLAEKLPLIQQLYSPDFTRVDPSIKTALALTSEAFAQIVNGEPGLEEQRRKLVDARAILELLLPDASYYFLQPLRDSIREEIAVCTSIVAAAVQADQPISPEQYEGCVSSFLNMGTVQAKNIPLSGNSTGPWEQEQLRRELSLTPWQRVNYLLAYLSKQYSNSCVDPGRVINPLEWSLQAVVMAWFTSPWPSLANTEVNENSVDKMLLEINQFNQQMTKYKSCLLGTNGDLIQRMQASYNLKLDELISSITTLEQQFRDDKLSPGADIKLDGGADQKTNYRPEALEILPCDTENTCDMTSALPATLALVGLFPSPYLVADQSRMGRVEICYDKVRWVDRRLTQTRENAPDVANYYAHLGFSIKGRFHQNDKVTDVFERSFVSPEEYHYLFAENDPAVLGAECPMAIVGQPIITKLYGSRLNIVPDRLTYLSASRALPSRLLAENWEKGAEWRDWFVTGRGVDVVSQSDGTELLDPVNNYLHSLRESREAMLYTALLSPPLSNQPTDSLAQRVSALSVEKSLLRSTLAIFYGELLTKNEWVRASVTGQNGLVDRRVLRRLREAGVPVRDLGALARSRSQSFSEAWRGLFAADRATTAQDEAAISSMLATAWLQLKHLQQQQLQAPLLPLEPVLRSELPTEIVPGQPSVADPAVSAGPSN